MTFVRLLLLSSTVNAEKKTSRSEKHSFEKMCLQAKNSIVIFMPFTYEDSGNLSLNM